MPNTEGLTHERMNKIGAGRLFYKVTTGKPPLALFELGLVEDVSFNLGRTVLEQTQRVRGVKRKRQQRLDEETANLSFTLLENVNPVVSKYGLSPHATPVKEVHGVRAHIESFKLFGPHPDAAAGAAGEAHEVGHSADVQSTMPDPVGMAGVVGAGGAIAADTYSYAVVAWFDAAETLGMCSYPGTTAGGDDDAADGLVIAGPPGNATVTLTWDPPAGVTPHHYSIYMQDTVALTWDPANASQKVHETTDTDCILTSHPDLGSETFGAGAPPTVSLTSWDGLTTYVLNTDYTFDAPTGRFARIKGGAIGEGETVVALYVATHPVSIRTDLGVTKAIPTYLEITILQLEEGEDGYEEGDEWVLHKVNVCAGDVTFPFSADDWRRQMTVTWEALFDATEGRMGYKIDKSGHFAGIDTNY